MFTTTQLAALALAYSEAGGSIAALGKTLFADHRFFKKLMTGGGCTARNAEKASRWFVDNWPETVVWPDSVPLVCRQCVEAA